MRIHFANGIAASTILVQLALVVALHNLGDGGHICVDSTRQFTQGRRGGRLLLELGDTARGAAQALCHLLVLRLKVANVPVKTPHRRAQVTAQGVAQGVDTIEKVAVELRHAPSQVLHIGVELDIEAGHIVDEFKHGEGIADATALNINILVILHFHEQTLINRLHSRRFTFGNVNIAIDVVLLNQCLGGRDCGLLGSRVVLSQIDTFYKTEKNKL